MSERVWIVAAMAKTLWAKATGSPARDPGGRREALGPPTPAAAKAGAALAELYEAANDASLVVMLARMNQGQSDPFSDEGFGSLLAILAVGGFRMERAEKLLTIPKFEVDVVGDELVWTGQIDDDLRANPKNDLEIEFDPEEIDAAQNWADGQDSMLYAIASTGSLKLGTRRPRDVETDREWFDDLASQLEYEVERCLKHAEKMGTTWSEGDARMPGTDEEEIAALESILDKARRAQSSGGYSDNPEPGMSYASWCAELSKEAGKTGARIAYGAETHDAWKNGMSPAMYVRQLGGWGPRHWKAPQRGRPPGVPNRSR